VENAEHRAAGLRAFAGAGAPRSWVSLTPRARSPDFYLDEREVTRGEFLAFLQDPRGYADASRWPRDSEPPTGARTKERLERFAGEPELPAADVTWEEASAFASWMGRRLPSWVEIEYAARGGPSGYRPFASFRGVPPDPGSLNTKGLGPAGPGRAARAPTGRRTRTSATSRGTSRSGRRLRSFSLAIRRPATARRTSAEAPRDAVSELRLSTKADEGLAYWIAGGSFREENFFFEAAAARPRRWSASHVGFRCALSIEEVRAGLARRSLEEGP
jgi:hypothetical protein